MLCTDNEGFGSDESMEEDPAGESDFDANQGVSFFFVAKCWMHCS